MNALKSVEARCSAIETKLDYSIFKTRRSRGMAAWRSIRRKATKSGGMMLENGAVARDDKTNAHEQLEPGHYVVQVVLLCLAHPEHPGKASQDLLAIEDSAYERRDISWKLSMAQQVQSLRLITWLLQGNRSIAYRGLTAGQRRASIMVRNANLVSTYFFDQKSHFEHSTQSKYSFHCYQQAFLRGMEMLSGLRKGGL